MLTAVDTNMLIRLLTRDDEEQYQQAYNTFQHHRVYISNSVFLETEWVLRYAYEYGPDEIVSAFTMLLGLPCVDAEDTGRIALVLQWHHTSMDFADALHLASSLHCGELHTFDRKFIRKSKGISPCVVKKPDSKAGTKGR